MHRHCEPAPGQGDGEPRPTVADIVRLCGEDFVRDHAPSPRQRAVLRDIARCRTPALGGHADVCLDCGHAELGRESVERIQRSMDDKAKGLGKGKGRSKGSSKGLGKDKKGGVGV